MKKYKTVIKKLAFALTMQLSASNDKKDVAGQIKHFFF